MSTVWNELAVQSSKDMGAVAYASKQSAMYCKRAVDCLSAFQKAQAVAEPAKSVTQVWVSFDGIGKIVGWDGMGWGWIGLNKTVV